MSNQPPPKDQITITQCMHNTEGHNASSISHSRSPPTSCDATRLRLSRFQERLAATVTNNDTTVNGGRTPISRKERRKRRYDPSSDSDDDFVSSKSKPSFSATKSNSKSTGIMDQAIFPPPIDVECNHFPFSFDTGVKPKSPLSREDVIKKHNNLLLKNKRLASKNRLLRKEVLFLRQQMTKVKCCIATPSSDMIANWPLSDEEIDNHGQCVSKKQNR